MSHKSKAAEFIDEEYSLTINGRNVQVTDAMRDYAAQKLSKIEKYGTRIIDAVVTMDVRRFEHIVDIVVKLNQIKIKASAATDDMYASIDKAVDKVEAQLRKYKQKIQNHHAKPLEIVDMTVNVIRPSQNIVAEINDEIEAENNKAIHDEFRPHEIVSTQKVPLKYLTLDEAIMKMELSQDHFLVFRNEKDRKINVIFRREPDGDYGILLPES
jgi:putative sigma-54 modulation protein